MPDIKTAEEIASSHLMAHGAFNMSVNGCKKEIINAMEEYANQFKIEFPIYRWVSDRLPDAFKVVPCKVTPPSPDPRQDTELHWGFVDKEGKWVNGWGDCKIEWLEEINFQ